MCTIEGRKKSCAEMSVAENISAYANVKGISVDTIFVNKNSEDLMEYLDLPETFDVKGKDFEEFCKKRIEKYLPYINILDYLETTVVNPKLLIFDIAVTYKRKDPIFVELNNFYHYKVINGLNSYTELASKLATDYAKKKLIEMSGYRFLEVSTMERAQKEYLEDIYKVI